MPVRVVRPLGDDLLKHLPVVLDIRAGVLQQLADLRRVIGNDLTQRFRFGKRRQIRDVLFGGNAGHFVKKCKNAPVSGLLPGAGHGRRQKAGKMQPDEGSQKRRERVHQPLPDGGLTLQRFQRAVRIRIGRAV